MVFMLVVAAFFIVARVAWHKTAPKSKLPRAPGTGRIISFLALVPLMFFLGLIATNPGANLVVVNAGFGTTPLGVRVVSGAVENRTGRSYGNVQVRIDLLNPTGDVIGFSIAAINSIRGGEAWKFDAPIDVEGAVGFRTSVDSPENRRPAWLGGCATTVC